MPDSPFAENGTEDLSAPGGEPIALSTLLDRGIRLEWHEAVAVVRDLCQLLRGTEAHEPVPDLRHIWICANGRMAIGPGTAGGASSTADPVGALGRLLLALVDETRMPVQLRLVALSAASTTPAYASVGDFSNALSYFERPGGALPIRPVYTRWHALAGENGVAAAATTPPPATSRQPPQAQQTPLSVVTLGPTKSDDALELFLPEEGASIWRGRGRAILKVAAGVAIVLLAAVLVVWVSSSRQRAPGPVQAPAQPPADQNASADVPRGSPAAKDIDLDAYSNSPSASATRGRAEKMAFSGATRDRILDQPRRSRQTPGPAPDIATPSSRNSPRMAARPRVSPAPPAPRQPAIDEQLVVPIADPEEGRVYSAADQEVVPPVLLRPVQNLEPPAGSRPEDLSVIDVLVSDSGKVETVKLGAPARDYREAMLFSAIKTWRFKPATKDGHPVRYVKRVWLSISPISSAGASIR